MDLVSIIIGACLCALTYEFVLKKYYYNRGYMHGLGRGIETAHAIKRNLFNQIIGPVLERAADTLIFYGDTDKWICTTEKVSGMGCKLNDDGTSQMVPIVDKEFERYRPRAILIADRGQKARTAMKEITVAIEQFLEKKE